MHLTKDQKINFVSLNKYKDVSVKDQKQFKEAMKYVTNRGVALDCGGHVGIWTKRLSYHFQSSYCF